MTNLAQSLLIVLLSMFLALHFFILLKLIPYRIVWGGRLKSDGEMYRFEIISILLNGLFLLVVLIKASVLAVGIPKKIITYSLWIMTGLFLINTLGNTVSKNKLEKWLFTPITMLLALCSFLLAWSD